jgi:hypothetical protein
MKWFKHLSAASDDEFVAELEDIFGWEGYGRWWKILEIIAKQMDETERCHVEYSWIRWQSLLKGKRNKLETFLVHCQNQGKMKLEQNGNVLKIICPKLLELRDEYSRKSGQAPDTKQDKVAQEAEADTDTERNTSFPVDRVNGERTKIPIPEHNLEKKGFKNEIDFAAAAAACCSIIQRRSLSSLDSTILKHWLELYDFRGFLLPVLAETAGKFKHKNHGKSPASLSYFVERVKEEGLRP